MNELTVITSGELAHYEAMCRAIDAAYQYDDLKMISDHAELREAAARIAGNEEAEEKFYEIKLRAKRRLGELLKAQKTTVGFNKGEAGRFTGGSNDEPPVGPPTLAEIGISKKQSMEAQQLADVPREEFEAAFEDGGKPSVAEITGRVRKPKEDPREHPIYQRLKKIDELALRIGAPQESARIGGMDADSARILARWLDDYADALDNLKGKRNGTA